MRWKLALALAVACLVGCRGPEPAATSIRAGSAWVEAAEFISAPDGDTLKVRTAKHGEFSVRVAGIDCPEHGQAYWRVARMHLVDFAKSGELTVACYKTDQYKRQVCRVRAGSKDLGASLIEAGLAWHYKRFESEQTPDERALYAQLELVARDKHVGLWQDPDPMPPEVCRKARRSGEKCR